MEVLYERCAGLDVHKKTVKVCVLTPGTDQRPHKEIRTYGTKTADLLELRDWRKRAGLYPSSDGINRSVLETGV